MIRLPLRLLLAIAGSVLAYFIAAVIGAVLPAGGGSRPAEDRPHRVLMVAGPIHYDFLIPLDAPAKARFAFLETAGLQLSHPDAQWLLLGWGAREFYTSAGSYRDVSAKAVLKGVFGDASTLRADVLGAIAPAQELPAVSFSPEEYAAFLEAAAASFRRTPDGAAQALAHPGFTATDRFFEAEGRFHLLRTCNTWVARMIRASGRRFGAWTPLPYSVSLSHALFLKE
ncbi:TIGR02117 family protein [Leisingera sp. ANG-Vp]|uniref:TIGR02117 family protein n=1 Tax=Leisingera sp. ANG-Vp TaxID=1577896 RepID=UPI000690864C|nr:TIGR02117 family protein [Leisingera sp. ANG-Vp]